MKKGITLVRCKGWCAIYIDGNLLYEDYHIHTETLNDYLKLGIEILEVDDRWMSDNTCYPSKLKDVKVEKGSDAWAAAQSYYHAIHEKEMQKKPCSKGGRY